MGSALPMTFRAESLLVSHPQEQGGQPGTSKSSGQAQGSGLAGEGLCARWEHRRQDGAGWGPTDLIPWACNEVGPDSVTCNYSMKTPQETHPLPSPEMSYSQPLCHILWLLNEVFVGIFCVPLQNPSWGTSSQELRVQRPDNGTGYTSSSEK